VVGQTLGQHRCLRWTNKVCQRWANAFLLIGATLGQQLAKRWANNGFPYVFVGPTLAQPIVFLTFSWGAVGPTHGFSAQRWANVGPTYVFIVGSTQLLHLY